VPDLDRIVVAVDPPVTGHAGSDECGIVVVGVVAKGKPQDWVAYVLEDASVQGVTPLDWARKAIATFHRHGADRLVAEVNQGGDMIETLVRQVDPHIPFRGLRAGQKKGIRAEPVAALYEQARVKHVRGLPLLEDQMVRMTAEGYEGKGSPDRVDALVWAIYDLILAPSKSRLDPQIRGLG
jgi:phage terminase large subunit-like protein